MPTEQEVVSAVLQICDKDLFQPSGLLDYVKDINDNPDAYGIDFRPGFLDNHEIELSDITPDVVAKAVVALRSNHLIFGHAPIDVVKWFGAEGWNYSQVKRVLKERGFKLEKEEVLLAMGRGQKGKGVLELTEDQTGEIYWELEKVS